MFKSKNKTLAAWLAFFGGPLGLHRFYLHGIFDWVGWLLPIPTALGFYGMQRVQQFGQDDQLSWLLIPFLGFTIAGCALTAIIYAQSLAEFRSWGRADELAHRRRNRCVVNDWRGGVDGKYRVQFSALF
jgi:hypothetical protein